MKKEPKENLEKKLKLYREIVYILESDKLSFIRGGICSYNGGPQPTDRHC